MTISEPATLVTDYLLAIFTGTLAYWLWRAGRASTAARDSGPHSPAWRLWWAAAFAATAVAGVTGGTVHGFQHVIPARVLDVLWLVTLEGLVAGAYAVVRAAIVLAAPDQPNRRRAILASGLAFGAFAVWVVQRPVFLSAIAAYGTALVLLAAVRLGVRPLGAGGRLLIGGILVSAAAAAIQQSGWSLHRHFNHNDLYHVVQAVAVWLLYRGVRS